MTSFPTARPHQIAPNSQVPAVCDFDRDSLVLPRGQDAPFLPVYHNSLCHFVIPARGAAVLEPPVRDDRYQGVQEVKDFAAKAAFSAVVGRDKDGRAGKLTAKMLVFQQLRPSVLF